MISLLVESSVLRVEVPGLSYTSCEERIKQPVFIYGLKRSQNLARNFLQLKKKKHAKWAAD